MKHGSIKEPTFDSANTGLKLFLSCEIGVTCIVLTRRRMLTAKYKARGASQNGLIRNI